jgi:hypothetical protein
MTATRIQIGGSVSYWTTDAAGNKFSIHQDMRDTNTGGNVGGQDSPNAPTIRLRDIGGVDLHLSVQTVSDLLPGLQNFVNSGGTLS